MKRSSNRKLRVEQLENRAMLSVTASVLNGDTLSVIGDSNPNTIRVVQDAAATAWTVFNGVTNLGTFSNIRNININPKVGPDAVTVQGTTLPGSLTISGGWVGLAASVSGTLEASGKPAAALTIGGNLTITGGGGPDVVQLRSVTARSVTVSLIAGNDQVFVASTGHGADSQVLPGLTAQSISVLMGGGDDLVTIAATVSATTKCNIDGGASSTTAPGDTLTGSTNIHAPNAHPFKNFETLDPAVLTAARAMLTRPAWMRS